MKAALVSLALALLAEAAVNGPHAEASSVETIERRKVAFTLKQIANNRPRRRHAQLDLIRAHGKYGKELPDELLRALRRDPAPGGKYAALGQQANMTGTVPATSPPLYDTEYVIPMQIGTPPETLNVNLDTGSADLWVFSSETDKSAVGGQTLYHPERSSTSASMRGYSWKIKYGDESSASGVVYKDRVQVGATHFDRQAVEAAVQVSPEISGDSFASGILGLARSPINTVVPSKQMTYLENIQDKLAMPLFTANLKRQRPGIYNFGFIDPAEYTGDIEYASVDSLSPLWQITLGGFQVGGAGQYRRFEWKAIVDTGTSLLIAPEKIVTAYWDEVPGAGIDSDHGIYTFPCEQPLPDFFFGIDSYRGLVPGKYMNYGPMNGTTCYGGIQSSDKTGFAVLGDVLLKAQFVVFNIESGLVGFANKELDDAGAAANSTASSSTSDGGTRPATSRSDAGSASSMGGDGTPATTKPPQAMSTTTTTATATATRRRRRTSM